MRLRFRAYLIVGLVLLSILAIVPGRVAAAVTYSLDVTPTIAQQTQGESSTFTVIVEAVSGTPEVVLRVASKPSLPSDQDFSVQLGPTQNQASYNATLIVTSQASTPPNPYLFVIEANATAAPEVRQVALTVSVTAGSFTITSTPSSRSISKGDSAEFDLDIKPVGSFSQIAYLNAVPPSGYGITANVAPSQNIPPFTAKLRVYSSNTTPSGGYVANVQGRITSETGPLVYSAGMTVIVGPCNFTVTVTPASRTVYQGQTVAYNVTVEPLGNFYHSVALFTPGPPVGLTASFSPTENVPPFKSTLLVSVGAAVSSGTFSVTVRGTSSGGAVYETTASVKVMATDFDVVISPSSQGVMRGQSAYFKVNVTTTTFQTAPVDLAVTSLPPGMQAVLSKTHGTANFTANLVVSVTSTATPGDQFIAVQGVSGGLINYGSADIFVMLPDFAVSASPASASVSQGESATFTINVGTTGPPYTSLVSLTATPPSGKGITATITPSSGYLNFTATMVVTTSSTTPTGSYVITVAAVGSDSISHQTLVSVTVGASSFSISISPATKSLYQGEVAQFTVTVSKQGIFSSTVTLTASEVSGELAPAVGPSTGTPPFSATLVVTTALSTAAGDYVITVTGEGDGQTQEAGVVLSVKRADFAVDISPVSATIYQTQRTTYTITIAANPFFPETVLIKTPKITPSAQNLTAVVSPTSGTVQYGSFTADLIVTTGKNTAVGTYTITVEASLGVAVPGSVWVHSSSVVLAVMEKPPDYYVKIRTSGLTSEGYTTVYVDGKDQDVQLNDAANVTEVGAFDGLSTHTIKVESKIELTAVKFTCDVYSATVSADTRLTFKYQKWYLITWKTSGLPSGRTVIVKIGGVSYSEVAPVDLETWMKANKKLSFELVSPKTLQVEGKTYTFTKWVNSAGSEVTSPIDVTKSDVFTAQYARSVFYVIVYDVQGANITLGASSLAVPAEGYASFTVKPETYSLSTTQAIGSDASSGNVFKYWIIPRGSNTTISSNPTSITVSGDIEISVYRTQQVKLTLVSQYGTVSGAGWYDIGATAKFSVDASVPIDSGSRYYCSGYNGDATGSGNSGTVVMTGSKTITFQWQKQFLLTLVSQYGTKSGDGWYDVDATAQFSVSAREEAGVRYRFLSWAGDFAGTSPSGSVVMDGPKTTTANWKRELKTQLTFRDGDGQVLAKPPSKVVLSGPSGPVAFEAVNDVWLEEGAWSVQQVIYDGAEVSAGDFPFTASAPNATWEIAVQVYSLHVTVKGTLLQSSVVGSTVTVTLPDGSTASASMSNGTAVLAQLPAGRYNVQATGGLIPASTTVDLDHTRDLQVRVLGAIDAGAIAAIGAISAASAVLYMRWRKGHPATREEEKGAEEVEGGEEKKPLPPPPPDEETGSLKDFYKRSKS